MVWIPTFQIVGNEALPTQICHETCQDVMHRAKGKLVSSIASTKQQVNISTARFPTTERSASFHAQLATKSLTDRCSNNCNDFFYLCPRNALGELFEEVQTDRLVGSQPQRSVLNALPYIGDSPAARSKPPPRSCQTHTPDTLQFS
mmetsp:Transcript_76436/g.183125  ORF Transcript_76436/g.183125 Transcript_76436/m.183125 type:complete len:146 (-) Transcript_76436:748-1185(-)